MSATPGNFRREFEATQIEREREDDEWVGPAAAWLNMHIPLSKAPHRERDETRSLAKHGRGNHMVDSQHDNNRPFTWVHI